MSRLPINLPPNTALQRTRLRAPLSFKMFGATGTRRALASLVFLIAVGVRIAVGRDIESGKPPSFDQLYSLSKIVAVVRIESGAIGSSSSQIYRGRVTEVFKGAEMDRAVYFWGGNVGGGDSYLIGEPYLVLLLGGFRHLGDVLSPSPESNAVLYESAILNGPIWLRRDDRIDSSQSVFLFKGSAANSDIAGRGWVGRKEMIEYLRRLATKAAKH